MCLQAKDVKMNKRPQSDFEDPKLNGNLNAEDFRTILVLAVLCAARSSRGRPSMDEVFKEIDRVWKNRYAHKVSTYSVLFWLSAVLLAIFFVA